MTSEHLFHIPVMGTAFTIDTPLKVARFGVSSVVSLCDDELCEEMRQHYSELFDKPFEAVEKNDPDSRAKRITLYLNLLNDCVNEQVERMKGESFDEDSDLVRYFELLPEKSPSKRLYQKMLDTDSDSEKKDIQDELRKRVYPGTIDVNIMTKLDRDTYDDNGEKREQIYSDALSALRGYAESDLSSAIVFSAGFNRRLYAYIDQFDDFFPDETGFIKKKIILKVSDYRSSWTQGKFLAKKGVMVSEYRIESGLNCGGHAFASDGYLLGPILEEFKQNRTEMIKSLLPICNESLEKQGRAIFSDLPEVLITVQGGIGTFQENDFLLENYNIDRTGWATPFLLVPEVTVLDDASRLLLVNAEEKDLFLSGNSPLGIPFNTVRDSASEINKFDRYDRGRPGSPCPKGYLVSNTEFSKKPVCTASIFYQKRKLAEVNALNLSEEALKKAIDKVIVKTCLCEDLAASALIDNNIDNKRTLTTAICPGPNLAYFSKITTFKEMVGHIYGRLNVLNDKYRPNFMMAELKMYIDYFTKEISETIDPTQVRVKYLTTFKDNLQEGIAYYKDLIPKIVQETQKYKDKMSEELGELAEQLESVVHSYASILEPSLNQTA